MKYDILNPFKAYLYQNLTKNTARKYYSSVVKLFENKQFNNITDIDENFIEQEIMKFKTKNEFSAARNAIKRMKIFYPDLDVPDENFFNTISKKKRNWNKKPKKVIYLDPTKRKINQIKNRKLRLAYRLALVSALRVSEVAALTAGDITFDDNEKIIVNVQHGKGGSNGIVECLPDHYLYINLKQYVMNMAPEDKLFYSEVYMREKADELGMECHDFRRICAITYRNELKKEMPVTEANTKVQAMLRHKRFSTTKRYLFNRKLIFRQNKNTDSTEVQREG